MGSEFSEAMDTGPTLTSSLSLHVADDSSRFSQGAMAAREQDDDSGTQRGVQLPGRFFAETAVEKVRD